MKKILFGTIVTMFTLTSLQSTAQMKKGAYVGLNAGYGAAAGAANVLNIENSSNTSTIDETEAIKFSFGKGVNAGLSFGYMFNENIGAELGVQYLIGGKTKYTETNASGGFGSSTFTGDVSAKMVQIKPTIVLATSMKNMTPYAKLGMVIGSGKITQNNQSTSTGGGATFTTAQKAELKGGMAIGFTAGMGLNFSVNDKLSINGEVNMVNMQYSPKKGTVIAYSENGVDKLSTLSVRDREIEFSKKVTTTSTPRPNTLPSQETSIAMPFGSIGINVGVKYNF